LTKKNKHITVPDCDNPSTAKAVMSLVIQDKPEPDGSAC